MIYILYGEDIDTAYARVNEISTANNNLQKINLTKEATKEALYGELFGQDLLGTKKLIICENLLLNLKPEELLRIQKEQVVIFWEQKKLTPAQIKKFASNAKIEEFKPKTYIFMFLDSIVPSSKSALIYLSKLEEDEALVWNLSNRLLCLTLAKLEMDASQASALIGRPLAPWQWQKINQQARTFTKETLLSMYRGLLKIDYLVKSGSTALGVKDLISVLLFKYLKA